MPSGEEKYDSSYGLFTIYEPDQPTVPELDIVFVHGLQGHATKTWTTSSLCWPKDLLPQDLPFARVMTFGYDTLSTNELPPQIRDLAKTLLDSLAINRRLSGDVTRPLIFVAHSLGGLIVKEAFLYSQALQPLTEDAFLVSLATKACIFFGTPHVKASKGSWTQIRSQIFRALVARTPRLRMPPTKMPTSAETENMLRLSANFCLHSGQMKLISIYETLMTSTNRGKLLVLPRDDTVMDVLNETRVAVESDHMHMTKFDDATNEIYRLIVGRIRELLKPQAMEFAKAGTVYDDEQLTVDPEVDSTNPEEFINLVESERRFLANLKPEGLNDMLIRSNSEGSWEWIIHSREFHDWLNLSGSESTLWIRGPSGVGKTILARFLYAKLYDDLLADPSPPIVQNIQWASATTDPHPASFIVLAYFFGSGKSMRNKGLSVLQSLLYQVLSTDLNFFRYVRGKKAFRQPQRGDFRQYMELLSAILQDASLSGTVIVLDAFDECEEASRPILIKSLVAIASQSRVKMLVTSRSQSAVEIEPSIRMTLDYLNEDIDRDINRYLTTSVKDIVGKRRLSAQLEQEIIAQLMKIPSKSYLWTQLVLQGIEKALRLRNLRKKLDQLPPSLLNLYSEVLSHSHGLTAITLRRTLYFVMVAEEPLQTQELAALLAISETWDLQARNSQKPGLTKQTTEIAKNLRVEDTLVNKTVYFDDFMPYFRALLRINEGSMSIIHFTLQEFLQQRSQIALFQATFGPSWPGHVARSDSMPEVHATMAILCLQYMLAAFRDRGDALGFRAFAAIHWAEHARKAGEYQNEVLKALIMNLFDTTEFVSAWLHILRSSKYAHKWVIPSTPVVGLILAAFDLGSLYGDLLGMSWESLAINDFNHRTPLHFAAANNAISSVHWIKEVCTNGGMLFDNMSTQTDTEFHTPLHLAAQRGHREIVELLLDWTHSKFSFDGEVFEIFAINGYKQIFGTLYEKTEIRESYQLIHVLNQAAKLDSIDLMDNITFDFNSRVNRGLASLADLTDNRISLLHSALKMQSTTVLNLLLNKEGLCEAVDRSGWTALHVAADEGNVLIASQLIEKGIWINAQNWQGDAALHIATRNKFPEVVRLLCDEGSIVGIRNNTGQLPAHLAAESGDVEILQTLCRYSTNFLQVDDEGRTVLHTASKAGPEATVHILMAAGADVNAKDSHGRTPLHYAVESRDLRILYSLLIAGAQPMDSDHDQICPIHLAAEQGSEMVIQALLNGGRDPNCRDSQGRTPLHHSCASKRSTIPAATTLLESEADVRACDTQGIQPIHLAAEQGSESLVRLLMSHGADVNCSDTEGRTPLHYGCFSKRSTTAVVKLLIRSGSKIDGPNSGIYTPLYYAKQNNKSLIVKLLTDLGAC